MDQKINSIIRQIADDCIYNYSIYSHKINFSDGCAGIAVFFATLYKATNEEKYKQFAELLIDNSIEILNNSSHSMVGTFFDGISGIAWSLLYLRETGTIDFDDSVLEDFDELILKFLSEPFEKKEYDLLHGYLGIGFYILSRKMKDYKSAIELIINKLYENNESDKVDEMKWHDYWGGKAIIHTEGKIWNLGLAHGIPSIIIFLCKCYKAGICLDESREAVKKALTWLNKQKNGDNVSSCFPISITTYRKYPFDSRLGWCYGDFGSLFAFLHAGQTFNNKNWLESSKHIIKKIAVRRVHDQTMVRDSSFCHGASGIVYMLSQIQTIFDISEISESKAYWMNYIMKNYEENQNDFLTYYKRDDEVNINYVKEFGLLVGVSGIGLALLGSMQEDLTDWSDPFLINL